MMRIIPAKTIYDGLLKYLMAKTQTVCCGLERY